MTHLSPAEVVALRDGEALAPDRAHHPDSCPRCREAVERARFRARRIEASLPPAPPLPTERVESARQAVRARLGLDAGQAADPRPASGRGAARAAGVRSFWSLSRAAGVLLLVAGGAAAMPGSPVRQWIGSMLETPATPEAVQPRPAASSSVAAPDGETGIRVRVEGGPVAIEVEGLPPGARVEVVREAGPELAVFAPDGSRFRTADGRVTVEADQGPVHVHLPAAAGPATLWVGGRVYLRWSTSGPEIPGPGVRTDDGRIVFEVGG